VIDASVPGRVTVSEGQAYGLMFALIANDRAAFDKILGWTQVNMANGHLDLALPAWKWGRAEGGESSVLDPHSAADADLWFAYALGESARLWHENPYGQLARAMAGLILRDEVAWIPELGATLIPGPIGFVSEQTWRLNASYSPVQVLRAIRQGNDPTWKSVLQSSLRVIEASSPRGYASDWVSYRPLEGFISDSSTLGVGSYDAIRVYLWAGMLAEGDSEAAALRRRFEPMVAAAAQDGPPEFIDTQTLAVRGSAQPGFLAALLPLLAHVKQSAALESYRKIVMTRALSDDQHYYSDALTLFGLGWLDGRYRFDRRGHIRVSWGESCRAH
jgi:endo-1,4-beta-D-glucanase Y